MGMDGDNCCTVSQIQIKKDSDVTFNVVLMQGCDPMDLSTATEIQAIFQTTTSTPLIVSKTGGQITLVPGSQGKVQIALTRAQTVTLQAGDQQSFEMLILIAGIRSIAQFPGQVNVVERIFPGAGD